jgi:SAM-dependent methyltransferase
MATQLYWNPNTLVLPLGGGLFRLFQVSARRNLIITRPVIELIDLSTGGADSDKLRCRFEELGEQVQVADATTFTLWDNAYCNSDFFDASVGTADLQALPWEEFLELLQDSGMVSDCWPPPTDQEKRHFADRFRGSFYEQIATESLFHRTTPTAWWTAQKFEPGHASTRPTPYRYIEERFLDTYFAANLGGADVLEIGCGTGYFTARMARHARRVVGVDYNSDYVAIARQTWTGPDYSRLGFQVGDIIDLSRGAPAFAQDRYDFVLLIDTFLFLFDARYQPELHQQRDAIMANLRRLLKPDGLLLVMDPHPLWLTPWLGHPEAPFGILTEYRQRSFKVIPTLEEMTTFLCAHGLRIRRVLEPRIDKEFRDLDTQRFAFMNNVPQWWFFEIEPGPATSVRNQPLAA